MNKLTGITIVFTLFLCSSIHAASLEQRIDRLEEQLEECIKSERRSWGRIARADEEIEEMTQYMGQTEQEQDNECDEDDADSDDDDEDED